MGKAKGLCDPLSALRTATPALLLPVMFQYPPFGFSVWYDRHKGRRWCWEERIQAGHDDDVVESYDHRARNHAIQSIRDELRRRGARDAAATTGAAADATVPDATATEAAVPVVPDEPEDGTA